MSLKWKSLSLFPVKEIIHKYLKPSQKATRKDFHQQESDEMTSLWDFYWTLCSDKQYYGASYHRTGVFFKENIILTGQYDYFSIVKLCKSRWTDLRKSMGVFYES